MHIRKLKIETNRLTVQKYFYSNTLGLPIIYESNDEITLQAGESLLTFVQVDKDVIPAYHFAFNIPSFKVYEAMEWLDNRVKIITDGHQKIIDFRNWNAHSVYFKDPVGNILEFIARRDLFTSSFGDFIPDDVLSISEIGIPTKNVKAAFEKINKATGIKKYSGDLSEFCAAGDPNGLLIIVDEKSKIWYPTEDVKAVPAPMHIMFEEKGVLYHLTDDQQADGEFLIKVVELAISNE